MATYLCDTNLLIRFCDSTSASFMLIRQTVKRLLAHEEQVYLTTQNIIEFWAVATRPKNANGLGWDVSYARSEVEQLLNLFPVLEDVPNIFEQWFRLVTTHTVSGKQVHDARLVAVMLAHGVTHLLTLNTVDFARYTEITPLHPSEVD